MRNERIPERRRVKDARQESDGRRKSVTAAPKDEMALHLRLYVSGGAPNSQLAIANLETLRRAHLGPDSRIEIVDVFYEPDRALADAVLLTPMLVKVTPDGLVRILGTLADTQAVLSALGVRQT